MTLDSLATRLLLDGSQEAQLVIIRLNDYLRALLRLDHPEAFQGEQWGRIETVVTAIDLRDYEWAKDAIDALLREAEKVETDGQD